MARFTLRLPETLHSELEKRAVQEGVSLNQYVVYALTRHVANAFTIEMAPQERVAEQRARYETLVDRLGEASQETVDAFMAGRESVATEDLLTADLVTRLRARFGEALEEGQET